MASSVLPLPPPTSKWGTQWLAWRCAHSVFWLGRGVACCAFMVGGDRAVWDL